tara:strand:- start:1055 stop:1462 length:408 start_codon:yes stop_codon:yes gene_type:complete
MLEEGMLYGVTTKSRVGIIIQTTIAITVNTYKAIDFGIPVLNPFFTIPICMTKADIEMTIGMRKLNVKVEERTSERSCTATSNRLILNTLLNLRFSSLSILLNFERTKGWTIRYTKLTQSEKVISKNIFFPFWNY